MSKKKRASRKGAEAGGYNWELGSLVFDSVRVPRKKKEDPQEPTPQKAVRNSRNDYHRKHG